MLWAQSATQDYIRAFTTGTTIVIIVLKTTLFCINIEKTDLNHLNSGHSSLLRTYPVTLHGKAWWSRLKIAWTNLFRCTWLATTDNKVLWWHYMSHRRYPSDWQEQSPLESSRSLRGKKEDTLVVACSHITEETFYPSFFALLLFFFFFFYMRGGYSYCFLMKISNY